MKKAAISLVLILIMAGSASAATFYITDLTEISVRSGPGVKYRLIKTLESGQAVEVLETQGEWSRVSLGDGTEGWAASRYLTDKMPDKMMVQSMKDRIGPLENQIQTLQEENQGLITMNQELAEALEKTRKERDDAASSFNSLKAESKEFLDLKGRYEAVSAELGKKEKQADELQARIKKTYLGASVKWFLAGAGVLLIGIFLGNRSKKKRTGLR